MVKTVGYLISSFSVVCLGVVSWSSAAEHPTMLAILIVGMATSILGMLCRWTSYRREKQAEARAGSKPAEPEIRFAASRRASPLRETLAD